MHILFFCITYMQVILAIQIKRTLYQDCSADLIISDHSVNAENIAKNLSKINLFDRVLYCESKKIIVNKNFFSKMIDIPRAVFSIGKKFRRLLWEDNNTYDLILYYNLDIIVYTAYDLSIKMGTVPKCLRFEEGLFGYHDMCTFNAGLGRQMKTILWLRKLIGRQDIFDSTEDCFCCIPEIFPRETSWNIHNIPLLSKEDKKLPALLNRVFDYHPIAEDFRRKYIYFASSADVDGKHISEADLVAKIGQAVGLDNLIIKPHPRDVSNVYKNNGFTVMENSSVPWEVIQLNYDFSSHVFLTLSSGSVLNASAMLGDSIPTYYLYPYVKTRNKKFFHDCETSIRGRLESLQKMGKCQTHVILDE